MSSNGEALTAGSNGERLCDYFKITVINYCNIILITDQGVHDTLVTSDANTQTAGIKGKTDYVKLSLRTPSMFA